MNNFYIREPLLQSLQYFWIHPTQRKEYTVHSYHSICNCFHDFPERSFLMYFVQHRCLLIPTFSYIKEKLIKQQSPLWSIDDHVIVELKKPRELYPDVNNSTNDFFLRDLFIIQKQPSLIPTYNDMYVTLISGQDMEEWENCKWKILKDTMEILFSPNALPSPLTQSIPPSSSAPSSSNPPSSSGELIKQKKEKCIICEEVRNKLIKCKSGHPACKNCLVALMKKSKKEPLQCVNSECDDEYESKDIEYLGIKTSDVGNESSKEENTALPLHRTQVGKPSMKIPEKNVPKPPEVEKPKEKEKNVLRKLGEHEWQSIFNGICPFCGTKPFSIGKDKVGRCMGKCRENIDPSVYDLSPFHQRTSLALNANASGMWSISSFHLASSSFPLATNATSSGAEAETGTGTGLGQSAVTDSISFSQQFNTALGVNQTTAIDMGENTNTPTPGDVIHPPAPPSVSVPIAAPVPVAISLPTQIITSKQQEISDRFFTAEMIVHTTDMVSGGKCPCCNNDLVRMKKERKCVTCGVFYLLDRNKFTYFVGKHDPLVKDSTLVDGLENDTKYVTLLEGSVCIKCYSLTQPSEGNVHTCPTCLSVYHLEGKTWKVAKWGNGKQ